MSDRWSFEAEFQLLRVGYDASITIFLAWFFGSVDVTIFIYISHGFEVRYIIIFPVIRLVLTLSLVPDVIGLRPKAGRVGPHGVCVIK